MTHKRCFDMWIWRNGSSQDLPVAPSNEDGLPNLAALLSFTPAACSKVTALLSTHNSDADVVRIR
jgi:hypothetical protein